jgi:hypothetical protein
MSTFLDIVGDSDNFDAFDNTDQFDNTEQYDINDLENEAYFLISDLNRKGNRRGARVVNRYVSGVKQLQGAIRASNGVPSGAAGEMRSVAQLSINIKRVTNTISENLPFVIFGRTSLKNYYKNQIVNPLLPSGVTYSNLSVAAFATSDKVIFTYTQALNTDTVEVTLQNSNITYPELLEALYTNMFEIGKIRHVISDTTTGAALAQQNLGLFFFKNTMFGKTESNTLNPVDYKNPQQQQAGIIDIPETFRVDQERGIAGGIVPVAGQTLTLSLFISNTVQNKA